MDSKRKKPALFGKRKPIPMDFIAQALRQDRVQAPILQTVKQLELADDAKFNAWVRACLMAKCLGAALGELTQCPRDAIVEYYEPGSLILDPTVSGSLVTLDPLDFVFDLRRPPPASYGKIEWSVFLRDANQSVLTMEPLDGNGRHDSQETKGADQGIQTLIQQRFYLEDQVRRLQEALNAANAAAKAAATPTNNSTASIPIKKEGGGLAGNRSTDSLVLPSGQGGRIGSVGGFSGSVPNGGGFAGVGSYSETLGSRELEQLRRELQSERSRRFALESRLNDELNLERERTKRAWQHVASLKAQLQNNPSLAAALSAQAANVSASMSSSNPGQGSKALPPGMISTTTSALTSSLWSNEAKSPMGTPSVVSGTMPLGLQRNGSSSALSMMSLGSGGLSPLKDVGSNSVDAITGSGHGGGGEDIHGVTGTSIGTGPIGTGVGVERSSESLGPSRGPSPFPGQVGIVLERVATPDPFVEEREQLKLQWEAAREAERQAKGEVEGLRQGVAQEQERVRGLQSQVGQLLKQVGEYEAARRKVEELESEVSELKEALQRESQGRTETEALVERMKKRAEEAESKLAEQQNVAQMLANELKKKSQMVSELKERTSEVRNEGWVDNAVADACMQCSKTFGLTKRKHHCRACGKIFCSDCSNNQAQLPSAPTPQRVCDGCYLRLLDLHTNVAGPLS